MTKPQSHFGVGRLWVQGLIGKSYKIVSICCFSAMFVAFRSENKDGWLYFSIMGQIEVTCLLMCQCIVDISTILEWKLYWKQFFLSICYYTCILIRKIVFNITFILKKVWRYQRGITRNRKLKTYRLYNGLKKKKMTDKQLSIKHYTENSRLGTMNPF